MVLQESPCEPSRLLAQGQRNIERWPGLDCSKVTNGGVQFLCQTVCTKYSKLSTPSFVSCWLVDYSDSCRTTGGACQTVLSKEGVHFLCGEIPSERFADQKEKSIATLGTPARCPLPFLLRGRFGSPTKLDYRNKNRVPTYSYLSTGGPR